MRNVTFAVVAGRWCNKSPGRIGCDNGRQDDCTSDGRTFHSSSFPLSVNNTTTNMEEPSTIITTEEKQQVCPFYLENRCRFGDQCWNVHPPELLATRLQGPPLTGKCRSSTSDDGGNISGGKARMRTANEVIHRIQWDPSLNAPDFLVVYLDRFAGLASVPLTEFAEMMAGPETVIPQHRIERICYKTVQQAVWDKRRRLDYVFNSTGQADKTLQELLRSFNDS